MISDLFAMIGTLWEEHVIPLCGGYLIYKAIYSNPNNNNKVK